MKPAPFAYLRPGSLADAVAALAEAPDAKVLAGGQSLVPLLSMRLAAPATLVDINGLPGLADVTVSDDGVRVGALARHADVLASAEAARVQPLVAMALANVAHPTIRNRGTTVGSIVHADAAAEMPVVLRLLGGSIEVESAARGRRTIPAEELFLGPLESSVEHDEIADCRVLPGAAGRCRGGVRGDRPPARRLRAAAASPRWSTATPCGRGYLSVSDVPTVVDLGGVPEERWGDVALEQLDPADDIHATADYRAHLARILTARVVRAAYDDAKTRT